MINEIQNLKLEIVLLKKENGEMQLLKKQIIDLKKEIFDLNYLRKEIENVKNENTWLKVNYCLYRISLHRRKKSLKR
jgi:hypothetical protein